MKLDWKGRNKRWAHLTVSGCIIVLFYVVLRHLGAVWAGVKTVLNYFLPVIVGAAVAYILNPLVKLLRRSVFRKVKSHRTGEGLSVAVTVVLVLVVLALLLGTLIPQLIESIVGFLSNIDDYAGNLQKFIRGLDMPSEALEEWLDEFLNNTDGLLDQIVSVLSRNINTIISALSSVGSSAVNWVISFILAIYFLVDKRLVTGGAKKLFRLLLPEKSYTRLAEAWSRFNQIFSQYIAFDLLDALIVGVANYLFMKITGMPYALLVSVVVGVTNLVPTFGPIVGAVIGAFILLLVKPVLVLWFLIFTIVLQTVDGYIIKPKMFGSALNVPSFLILIAIVVGGRMFGVVGILLAIPVAALLEYLYHDILIPKLEARKARKSPAPAQPPQPRSQENAEVKKADEN